MKKRLIFIALITIIIGVGAYFITSYLVNQHKEELINDSIDLSNTVLKFRHGQNTISQLRLSDSNCIEPQVFAELSQQLQLLETQNNAVISITDLYNKQYANPDFGSSQYGGAPSATDKTNGTQSGGTNTHVVQTTSDDSRILSKNGVDYIYVRDLDFSQTGTDIISYKGAYITLSKNSVPETYAMMVKDPNNIYKYLTYGQSQEPDRKYVDVQFTTLTTGNTVIVRVFNNGSKIINFEVL